MVFINHYLPGNRSGGPVRTIANMVDHLSNEFEFAIVTANRDLGADIPYASTVADSWQKVGEADVYYVSNGKSLISAILRILSTERFDLIYFNSLFNLSFTTLPLLLARLFHSSTRILLAPRGELSKGALQLKPFRKSSFLWITSKSGLYKNVEWQASSALERADIQRAFSRPRKVHVAIDLPPANVNTRVTDRSLSTSDGRLRVVFLSRISPMKNLSYALEILTQVTEPILFSIFGPVGDREYWEKCQKLIKLLPSNIDVKYGGVADQEDVPTIMREHDLFFLPTLGENYGHAIAEALMVGTPVLIANTTPWLDLISDNLGWDLPLHQRSDFIEAIHAVAKLSTEERAAWREQIRYAALERLKVEEAIQANRDMFRSLLG